MNEACRNPAGIVDLSTYTGFTSGITGTGELYAAIPRTRQGVDEHNRIGDAIQPISCTLHLDIAALVTLGPMDRTVHVFLMTAKSVKALDNYTAIPITQLLDKGDGTNTIFDGTSFTSMLPVNAKNFTVLKHKKIRLVKGFGGANASAVGGTAGTTDGSIVPQGQYHHLRMKVKLPKKLVYDSAPTKYPTNAAPFWCIGWTNNSSVDAASNTSDILCIARTEMRFKDL